MRKQNHFMLQRWLWVFSFELCSPPIQDALFVFATNMNKNFWDRKRQHKFSSWIKSFNKLIWKKFAVERNWPQNDDKNFIIQKCKLGRQKCCFSVALTHDARKTFEMTKTSWWAHRAYSSFDVSWYSESNLISSSARLRDSEANCKKRWWKNKVDKF